METESENNQLAVAAPEKKAQAPLLFDPKGQMQFTNIDDMWRFAKWVAGSGMAPKGMEKPEAIVVAGCFGREIGLPFLASLQCIAVVNGRPAVFGDAQLAVVRSSGQLQDFLEMETNNEIEPLFREYCLLLPDDKHKMELLRQIALLQGKANSDADDFGFSCFVWRKGMTPQFSRFTVKDCKRAGLYGTNVHAKYPKRMLQWRARGYVLRDQFGDYLKGLRSAEEQYGEEIDITELTKAEAKPNAFAEAVKSANVVALPTAPAQSAPVQTTEKKPEPETKQEKAPEKTKDRLPKALTAKVEAPKPEPAKSTPTPAPAAKAPEPKPEPKPEPAKQPESAKPIEQFDLPGVATEAPTAPAPEPEPEPPPAEPEPMDEVPGEDLLAQTPDFNDEVSLRDFIATRCIKDGITEERLMPFLRRVGLAKPDAKSITDLPKQKLCVIWTEWEKIKGRIPPAK